MERMLLTIPVGYRLEEEEHWFPRLDTNWLYTRKRKNYSLVKKEDDKIKAVRHVLICPHCGHRVYAYPRQLNRAFGLVHKPWPTHSVYTFLVETFTDRQLSLLGEMKEMPLSPPQDCKDPLECPACKCTMEYSTQNRRVELWQTRHKIYIRCQLLNIKEALTLPFGKTAGLLGLTHQLCFNLKKGTVSLGVFSGDRCCSMQDALFLAHQYKGPLADLLGQNTRVKRVLKHWMEAQIGQTLPIPLPLLTYKDFCLFTQFQGYPLSFYHAIPLEEERWRPHKIFRQQAKDLRKSKNLPANYSKWKLPPKKSVRKLLFRNPGLLFYRKEISLLWEGAVKKNVDRLRQLLTLPTVFELLRSLKLHPAVLTFFADYFGQGYFHRFVGETKQFWRYMEYALDYAAMPGWLQKEQQELWRGRENRPLRGRLNHGFSIPYCAPSGAIPDTRMNGFSFVWLRTSQDYVTAGKILQNCLGEWGNGCNPVVIVKKGDTPVAALEIDTATNSLRQMYAANNQDVSNVPGLPLALQRWEERFGLQEQEYQYE